jgi:tRNA (cytidine56-2'-O)-methyltransferase
VPPATNLKVRITELVGTLAFTVGDLSNHQGSLVTVSMNMDKPSKAGGIVVLRIGHRLQRDMRVTTHVCLTARALGAAGVVISDVNDRQLVETVDRVTAEFGGSFTIQTGKPWRSAIMEWKKSGGKVVHLTAYGIPLPKIIDQVRRSKDDKLVVVGSEKVPGELFRLADWNVAVTNQPISEVSALGVFLDWFYSHRRLEAKFAGARLQIVPTERGKRVLGN